MQDRSCCLAVDWSLSPFCRQLALLSRAQASTGKRGLKGVLESRNQKDKIRMEQLLELVRTLATSWASMH